MPPQQAPAAPPQPAPAAQQNEAPDLKKESEVRAGRRAHRRKIEDAVDARQAGGQKPYNVSVKPGGGIDGGCEGKNESDEALRSLVP